ncbi:MAG: hypothetical protein LBB26_02250 [Puniceicoccales bacterium]|nr:hypothetical protein [Puniceicoccales bacterium]
MSVSATPANRPPTAEERKGNGNRTMEIPAETQIVDMQDGNRDRGRVFADGNNNISDAHTPPIPTTLMRASALGKERIHI